MDNWSIISIFHLISSELWMTILSVVGFLCVTTREEIYCLSIKGFAWLKRVVGLFEGRASCFVLYDLV